MYSINKATLRCIAMVLLMLYITLTGSDKILATGTYNISYTGNGTVSVKTTNLPKDMRLQVESDGTKYNYVYDRPETELPLQMGKGNYIVKVLSLVEGNKYKVIYKKNIEYAGDIPDEVIFKQSTNNVNWKDYIEYKVLSDLMLKPEMTDSEKVDKIYKYITKFISYDDDKVKTLQYNPTYMPEINKTLVNRKGICYDYASLFGGMLRYNNIPAKLIMGYRTANLQTYHAWNEVFIDGVWETMDLTEDALYVQKGREIEKFKKNDKFIKEKTY